MPSQGTSTFDLFALRFHFTAPEPVHFPAGETANLLRGQFGKILHRRDPETYARFFAPVRQTGVPSGLHDPPRPFVFRARHLDSVTLKNFHIGMNLFETKDPQIGAVLSHALHAELVRVEGEQILRLPLAATNPVQRVRIHFLSPTELKNSAQPEFGPLFARLRDRISTLRALYGIGPLEIDFEAIGQRAAAIQMTRCELEHIEIRRATGQRHPLGGFLGIAEYQGDLTEFIPYLKIAAYTGVGRQTVWGKGEISIETF